MKFLFQESREETIRRNSEKKAAAFCEKDKAQMLEVNVSHFKHQCNRARTPHGMCFLGKTFCIL